jgi:hypothetical protein
MDYFQYGSQSGVLGWGLTFHSFFYLCESSPKSKDAISLPAPHPQVAAWTPSAIAIR